MSEFKYTVKTEDAGKTLKAIVKEQFAFSSRLMTKLRKGRLITVNGEDMPSWIPLEEGDLVRVEMPEEKSEFPPENIPIDVVYEDDHILVINKQPGLVVHPTKGKPCHTLLNGLMYKILMEAGALAEEGGEGSEAGDAEVGCHGGLEVDADEGHEVFHAANARRGLFFAE